MQAEPTTGPKGVLKNKGNTKKKKEQSALVTWKNIVNKAVSKVQERMNQQIPPQALQLFELLLTPDTYYEVVEERGATQLCGLPTCGNPTDPNLTKGKYHVSLSSMKVYDLTELKNFCSELCCKNSTKLQATLRTTSVYSRPLVPVLCTLFPHLDGAEIRKLSMSAAPPKAVTLSVESESTTSPVDRHVVIRKPDPTRTSQGSSTNTMTTTITTADSPTSQSSPDAKRSAGTVPSTPPLRGGGGSRMDNNSPPTLQTPPSAGPNTPATSSGSASPLSQSQLSPPSGGSSALRVTDTRQALSPFIPTPSQKRVNRVRIVPPIQFAPQTPAVSPAPSPPISPSRPFKNGVKSHFTRPPPRPQSVHGPALMARLNRPYGGSSSTSSSPSGSYGNTPVPSLDGTPPESPQPSTPISMEHHRRLAASHALFPSSFTGLQDLSSYSTSNSPSPTASPYPTPPGTVGPSPVTTPATSAPSSAPSSEPSSRNTTPPRGTNPPPNATAVQQAMLAEALTQPRSPAYWLHPTTTTPTGTQPSTPTTSSPSQDKKGEDIRNITVEDEFSNSRSSTEDVQQQVTTSSSANSSSVTSNSSSGSENATPISPPSPCIIESVHQQTEPKATANSPQTSHHVGKPINLSPEPHSEENEGSEDEGQEDEETMYDDDEDESSDGGTDLNDVDLTRCLSPFASVFAALVSWVTEDTVTYMINVNDASRTNHTFGGSEAEHDWTPDAMHRCTSLHKLLIHLVPSVELALEIKSISVSYLIAEIIRTFDFSQPLPPLTSTHHRLLIVVLLESIAEKNKGLACDLNKRNGKYKEDILSALGSSSGEVETLARIITHGVA